MVRIRRKGVAVVETPKGFLVVADRTKKFILPGGGAERWETRRKATIRELYEETGLKTNKIKFLFSYKGKIWHSKEGKEVRNYAKVFLVEAQGKPKPRHEIKYINFWRPGSKLKISSRTEKVIRKYLDKKY